MTKEEMLELRAMMEEVVAPIKDDIRDVKERVTNLESKVDGVDTRLRKLEIKVENKVDSAIKATMDGHKDLTRKIDSALNVENRVESLENDMSAVKYYIKKQQKA